MTWLQHLAIGVFALLNPIVTSIFGFQSSSVPVAQTQPRQEIFSTSTPLDIETSGHQTYEATTSAPEIMFLSRNYVLTLSNHVYYFPFDVQSWMTSPYGNIKTEEDFNNFLIHPPKPLDSLHPLYIELKEINTSLLKKISDRYLQAGQDVYFTYKKLADADPNSFSVLFDGSTAAYALAKDKKYVYCDASILTDSTDFKSGPSLEIGQVFSKIDNDGGWFNYSRDHVYFFNYPGGCNNITILDRNSFQHATSSYFFDKNDVYKNTEYIETRLLTPLHADPNSFRVIQGNWTRDKSNLFYFGKKLEGGEPNTLEIMSTSYAKDAKQVYYTSRPREGLLYATVIQGADPKLFNH